MINRWLSLLALLALAVEALSLSGEIVNRNGRLMSKQRRRVPALRLQPRGTNESREPVPSNTTTTKSKKIQRKYTKPEDFSRRRGPKISQSDGMAHRLAVDMGFTSNSAYRELASQLDGLRLSGSSSRSKSHVLVLFTVAPVSGEVSKKSSRKKGKGKDKKLKGSGKKDRKRKN